jgi:hypothetical protein
MHVHFHSLFAGAIKFLLLLVIALQFGWGSIGIAACLLVDSGQLMSRLQKRRGAYLYAAAAAVQSILLFGIYATAWFVVYGK